MSMVLEVALLGLVWKLMMPDSKLLLDRLFFHCQKAVSAGRDVMITPLFLRRSVHIL